MEVRLLGYDPATGQLDLDELRGALSASTAAVYFENPAYLGFIEGQGARIAALAHAAGALCVVAVDPLSLGVLTPPADYGADIVCGDVQPLGIHMNYGGGHGGFIATRDEVAYVMQYPSRLFGIAPTSVPGEYGFGDVAYERTSFAEREEGNEWVGTASALWGITAGVYLALMGPQGMAEIGEGIMARARYAALRLGALPGVRAPLFQGAHFQEFVVNFDGTGRTVAEINRALLDREIFGGKDLSGEFPELGQSALYCVTEVHTQEDIDGLVAAVQEVIR
jgi:glycine dehydrogenase subunit 1